jgi:hypothetical protein
VLAVKEEALMVSFDAESSLSRSPLIARGVMIP